MKASITFYIGVLVFMLSTVQYLLSFSAMRIIGMVVGVFFIVFGWKIGWTTYKGFTIILGHGAITIGCLVCAYAVYQIPSLAAAPSLIEVVDLPLFWGLFTLFGGYCMIQHASCSCCSKQHDMRVNVDKAKK